jgi:hypothetical protein
MLARNGGAGRGANDGDRDTAMKRLKSEQLAVAALDALLASGLEITQHYYDPDPNEWYFKGPTFPIGPVETPEAAIKAAISALYSQLAEQAATAAAFSEELTALRAKLDQADGGDGLEPWRRAFDGGADGLG